MNKNYLDKNVYLISEIMHRALVNERIDGSTDNFVKKEEGVYVVSIRLLKRDSNKLVYNYVYYSPIFIYTYLYFLKTKNVGSIRFKEWGDHLVFINYDLLDNIEEVKINLDSLDSLNPLLLNDSDTVSYINRVKDQYYIASELSGILGFLSKLNYITNSYSEMAEFVDIAISKDYFKMVEKFFDSEYRKLDYEKDLDINIINSLIFVVKDIDKFIKAVSNKGYSINGEVQKWRAQINSMSGLLSSMDVDYRNSLYNHNNYFIRNRLIDTKFALDKNKFSFRNIHKDY